MSKKWVPNTKPLGHVFQGNYYDAIFIQFHKMLSYLHDPKHYQICIDRENPSVVYIALKNRLMTSMAKDWSLDEAVRLLQRLIEALDDDLTCVKDYIDKVKRRLEAKKDDTDFTRLHAFFMLSMCLSRPHQLQFDRHMKTLKDTKMMPSMSEPFDKAIRSKMAMAQKKYLSGDARQLPLGDLSKSEYRKCGLIATQKIRPEEPKKAKVEAKKTKTLVKTKKKSTKKNANESKASTTKQKSTTPTPKAENVEQPVAKKAKKTKVPKQNLNEVMGTLQAAKVTL